MQCLQYLFYHLLSLQNIEYVWKGIKTFSDPKNSTAPGPRTPVLKFLDPPLQWSFLKIYIRQTIVVFVIAIISILLVYAFHRA